MDETEKKSDAAPPPREGEGLKEASDDAVRDIERRGTGHAGRGDIG
ncbi:MAG: hypothetical protein ACK40O_11080 [Allosphingosinicella sp.]